MPPQNASPMPRLRRARWGVAFVSLALTLLALEVAARAWLGGDFHAGELRGNHWPIVAQFDAELGWANRPGVRGYVVSRAASVDFDYRARINSLGMRDPERSVDKPPGVRRIALLGDSVSWGWGVDDGARFSDLVERELGPGVEILNFAVPGYSTDQEYWVLTQRVAAFQPDMLLLCFILNDVLGVETQQMYGMQKPRFAPAPGGTWAVENRPVPDPRGWLARNIWPKWDACVSWSALFTSVRRARTGVDLGEHSDGALGVGTSSKGSGNPRRLNPNAVKLVREACDKLVRADSATHMLLAKLKAWCEVQSVPMLAFSIAHGHDQYLYEPDFERPLFQPGPNGLEFKSYLTERLREAGTALGFETFSVDHAMWEATSRGERLHCGDGHLNERGNEIVAQRLVPFLKLALERQAQH